MTNFKFYHKLKFLQFVVSLSSTALLRWFDGKQAKHGDVKLVIVNVSSIDDDTHSREGESE